MIFSEEMLQKVLASEKTVTRRPVKYNATGKAMPCRYVAGRDYALQGPPEQGSKARSRTIEGYRLIVKSVGEPMAPSPLTEAEARREGFDTAASFAAFLTRLYGTGWARKDFRRIEFELVEEGRGG